MTTATEQLAAALRALLDPENGRGDSDTLAATWDNAREALARYDAERAKPVTLGNRLMPGCECGAAEIGAFDRCRCD